MAKTYRLRKLGAALLVAAFAIQGCVHYRPTGDTPTLVDRVTPKTVEEGKRSPWETGPFDQDVLNLSNDLKTLMRKHMSFNRMMRLLSGTFQVLTAATAAALGATTGNLTAITALAGASAVTPHLQDIFDARAVAGTYRQGVELIERAEGQYFERRAKIVARAKARDPNATTQLVPHDTFTLDAARLYRQVIASVRVVERTLVAQLPTIEDLRRAVGELNEEFDAIEDEARQLRVSATRVQLRVGETAAVVAMTPDNVVTLVSSDRPDVAKAAVADGARSITITPVAPGTAHVAMLTDKAMRASVEVRVRAREAADVVVMAPQTVVAGDSFQVVLAGTTPAPKDKKIEKNALSVQVELRRVSGDAVPSFEGVPTGGANDAWNCKPDKQPAVMCHPKDDINAGTFAPHLQLAAKVPADYGRNPLTIVAEVGSQGPLTVTEKISVVTRHSMKLNVPPTATLATATTTPYALGVVNEGPSEAASLSLTLTVAGPATVDAPTAAESAGWKCDPPKTTTITCKRDRLGVETAPLSVPIKATGKDAVTITTEVKAASGPGASATTTAKAP